MISVGIHPDLVIAKTTKNDQGTLVVGVKEVAEVNPLDALNASGSVNFNKKEQDFLIYPPKQTNFDGASLDTEGLMKAIAEVKDPLHTILRQYTTDSNIKWDIFAGTDVTAANLAEELKKTSTWNKIYSNIVDQFITMMKPYVGETGKPMRMLFVRQSKAKHFPKLRTRFLDSNPFIEPMTVPAAASKLKYTKYELENGLDKADSVGGAQQVSKADAQQAEALFS